MKIGMRCLIALALMIATAPWTGSAGQTKKDVTITGNLVDLVSFVTTTTKQNVDAVQKSARAGNPLGLYDTKTRKLYLVGMREIGKSANDTLLPYIGVRVFITGKVYTKSGFSVILLSDIGKSIK